MIGGLTCLAFLLGGAAAPLIAPFDPSAVGFDSVLEPPSRRHLFGTDQLGRDLLTRVLFGARASLQAGVIATAVAMIVGVPIGMIAGYYRGWLDSVVARINDAVLAFPFIILAAGVVAIFGASVTNAAIAIGVAQVPRMVRIARGEALRLREENYVSAAISSGASDFGVLFRHMLPNMANTLIVQATIIIPEAIIAEAALSFLGFGAQPPTASWGVMLSFAQAHIESAPWFALFPGAAIVVATLSFNLLGDGLRDVLDPRMV